jgi:hypothetical protein
MRNVSCAAHWDRSKINTGILVEIFDRNSAPGRPRHGWEDNIKTDLK